MSSGCSSWWQLKIAYKIPKLYKKCPEGNYHLFWDRLCFCRLDQYDGEWHGGIYDFKNGNEYQYCKECQRR